VPFFAFGDEPSLLLSARKTELRKLVHSGKWEEAEPLAREILEALPEDEQTRHLFVKLLTETGRRSEALEKLRLWIGSAQSEAPLKSKLMRAASSLSRVYLTKSTLQSIQEGADFLVNRKYRDAVKKFKDALSVEPDNVEILLRMVQGNYLSGDYPEAAIAAEKALALTPWDLQVKMWLGRVYGAQKKWSLAIPLLTEAAKGDSNFQSELANIFLADVLWKFGQKDGAIGHLEKWTAANPYHLNASAKLAWFRLNYEPADRNYLFQVKKELQVALSRFDYVYQNQKFADENHLDRFLSEPDTLKGKLNHYLTTVEERINGWNLKKVIESRSNL